MGQYLLDFVVPGHRLLTLKMMSSAYRPDMPVSFISTELGFENESECIAFLHERNAVFKSNRTSIDTKESLRMFIKWQEMEREQRGMDRV